MSEPHSTDRRDVLLSLTTNGREKTTRAIREKESIFYETISGLTNSQLKEYIEMLKNLSQKKRIDKMNAL